MPLVHKALRELDTRTESLVFRNHRLSIMYDLGKVIIIARGARTRVLGMYVVKEIIQGELA